MTRPVPGKNYTAVTGDTLPIIASRAYGLSEKWPLIRNANQLKYKTSDEEEIQPGETVFIPVDPETVQLINLRNSL